MFVSHPEQARAIIMLELMNSRAFERIQRGDFKFEKDMKDLKRLYKQAKKLEAPQKTRTSILNNMAILNAMSGRVEDAKQQFAKIYEREASQNNIDGMVLMLLNQAALSGLQGHHEDEVALYDQAITIYEASPERKVTLYGNLIGNKMLALDALQQYEEVPVLFDQIRLLAGEWMTADEAHYENMMIMIYDSLIEALTHLKRLDEAHIYYDIATDLAHKQRNQMGLATLYFTRAHLALAESDPELARTYWQRAIDNVGFKEIEIQAGRMFLYEARYLLRQDDVEEARDFVNRALAIFKARGMVEDILMAQQLVSA
ncbi:MAG: hypothetical protein CL607_19750 [Anaerolineaceae bacterium]|nr:hypothetical protein [Anaerolineaceae bacterium]